MEHDQIIDRNEAKKLGISTYFTGNPCTRGHLSRRQVSNHTCIECKKIADKRYDQNNKDQIRENHSLWRINNATELKIYQHDWYIKNRDSVISRVLQNTRDHPELRTVWRNNNKSKIADDYKVWCQNNKARKTALENKRRAKQQNATPPWLTIEQFEEIVSIYENAKQMTEITGVEYQVDHIIPLTNKNVCGLHVPWNLQVLTKVKNIKKGNRFDQD